MTETAHTALALDVLTLGFLRSGDSMSTVAHAEQPRLFLSEAIGTALLLLGGLSVVIVMFGTGSPMVRLLPSETLRQTITGFLFGCTGGSIALSWVGKESGAHINPIVTLGFWMMRKIEARVAAGYVAAQLVGAAAGSLPLLLWGSLGRSVDFGATIPGVGYSTRDAMIGEAATTFALITTLCVFLAFRQLRRFTPFTMRSGSSLGPTGGRMFVVRCGPCGVSPAPAARPPPPRPPGGAGML